MNRSTFPLPIRAITLDLDDTLWPAAPVLVAAEQTLGAWLASHAPAAAAVMTADWRRATRASVQADFPDRRHDLGFLRRESLRRAMVAAGLDAGLAEPAFEVFLQARQQVSLYDDVLPTLARWASRYRLVALTNGNADIARIGLAPYFAASISAHESGFAKPDPRIFHRACQHAGVEPAQTLHIGDDLELDVLAARRAGLSALWLRRPDLARHKPGEAGQAGQTAGEPVADSLHAADRLLLQRQPPDVAT